MTAKSLIKNIGITPPSILSLKRCCELMELKYFGNGRMRFGYCHVVNNNYPSGWGMYAIGGSEDPTFLSEGNRFVASGTKEVRIISYYYHSTH